MEMATLESTMNSSTSAAMPYLPDISRPSGIYVQVVKPFFDLLFALFLLALSCPSLVIVSVLIKMNSRGPVIFKQQRYGKNGRIFNIYKFRTMFVDVPKEGRSPVSGRDPRITSVGRFLRKTSIDELPQLFNIIKGEMSFIGPRPEQKSIVEAEYTEWESQRFYVTPGITGLWQISSERIFPIHENLHHDFKYAKELSLKMDLIIIWRTLKVMIKSNTA